MSVDCIYTQNIGLSMTMEEYPPCLVENYRFQSLTELFFILFYRLLERYLKWTRYSVLNLSLYFWTDPEDRCLSIFSHHDSEPAYVSKNILVQPKLRWGVWMEKMVQSRFQFTLSDSLFTYQAPILCQTLFNVQWGLHTEVSQAYILEQRDTDHSQTGVRATIGITLWHHEWLTSHSIHPH